MSSAPEILFDRQEALGLITMNRPRQLNALTLGMIEELSPRLADWAADDQVERVVIEGAGEKAFCAGGDILDIYKGRRDDGHNAFGELFFPAEYRLNRLVKRFPKPYIALMDGVVMGGGVGVSVHGSHRVASERTLLAMPETGIGLYPDVGATYFLPRLPGKFGLFFGLTGWRLKAADCLYAGIATHYVESARLEELKQELSTPGAKVEEILAGFSSDPGPAPVADMREWIDRVFSQASVGAIMAALESESADWAAKAHVMMRMASPTSLELTFEQIRRGAELSFEDCMRLELRMTLSCLKGHDFYEGIRAAVVDKDRAPRWEPSSLGEVQAQAIEGAFQPLGENELSFE